MGMDIYGLNSRSKEGEYFRNSIDGWIPLWETVCEMNKNALNFMERERGFYNDNLLIDSKKSLELVMELDSFIYDDFKDSIDINKLVELSQNERDLYLKKNIKQVQKKLKPFYKKYQLNIKKNKQIKNLLKGGGSLNITIRNFEDFFLNFMRFKIFMRFSGGFRIC